MSWFLNELRANLCSPRCFYQVVIAFSTTLVATHLCWQLTVAEKPETSEPMAVASPIQIDGSSPGYSYSQPSDEDGDQNADSAKGKQLYQRYCADCHGEQGQGSDYYDSALIGDLPTDELAAYIVDTMPEDNPDAVVGEDASLVAQYIFDQFYSPAAQQRLNPPKQLFSRLTVRQFKESVADILRMPNHSHWLPSERGLAGRYFASRHWNDRRKLADQTDPQLDFSDIVPHFDPTREYAQLPGRESRNRQQREQNLMSDGFSVYWHGSVLAPRTGWYNIKVETQNGFQLHLNREDEPLIDYGVRSGDKAVHEASIYLLAGRCYPLKIYLVAYTETETSFRLLWTPPNGIEEIIPERYLLPHSMAPSLALATPFPADDSSTGYARGISISREWDEAVTMAAIEAAEWTVENLWTLAETKATDSDSVEKVKSYCRRVVENAFSKPLDPEEYHFFVEQHFQSDLPLQDQVSRVIILALKSPRFVYPEVESRDPNFEIARRLALVLWDSAPDAELLELAANGELTDWERCQAQIYRMAYHPRGRSKLLSTFSEWLSLDQFTDQGKDLDRFPEFDSHLKNDLRRSLDIFLETVLLDEKSDYRELFTANYLFATPRMAHFYELNLPAEVNAEADKGEDEENQETLTVAPIDRFHQVPIEGRPAAGLLTHPYLLSGLAHFHESSPIHRGVYVSRNFLGRTLKQPNDNFQPLSEDFNPELTNRERVEFQTRDTTCMGCHIIINPVGFSLENFDAAGKYRTMEKDKPIDPSSIYKTATGEKVELDGAESLAAFLIRDEQAQKSFIRQLYQLYVRQPIPVFDVDNRDNLEEMHTHFSHSNFNLRGLVVQIAKVTVEDLIQKESSSDVE